MGCNENNPCKGSNVKVAVSRCNHKCNPPTIYTTEILKPNCVCGNNALTQCMLMKENVKYIIKYDFTLLGEEITVPKNCIFEFDGGSLKNGTIVGQDTVFINVGDVDIWGTNLTRKGTWKEHSGGGGEQVQSDWNQTDDTKPDYIKNKPDITEDTDRPYDPTHFGGMGKVYLKKNIVNIGGVDKNILIQDAFNKGEEGSRTPNTNTVFVIQHDFDLNGADIQIPADCVLDFDGGSVTNGKLVSNRTILNGLYSEDNNVLKGVYYDTNLNILGWDKKKIGNWKIHTEYGNLLTDVIKGTILSTIQSMVMDDQYVYLFFNTSLTSTRQALCAVYNRNYKCLGWTTIEGYSHANDATICDGYIYTAKCLDNYHGIDKINISTLLSNALNENHPSTAAEVLMSGSAVIGIDYDAITETFCLNIGNKISIYDKNFNLIRSGNLNIQSVIQESVGRDVTIQGLVYKNGIAYLLNDDYKLDYTDFGVNGFISVYDVNSDSIVDNRPVFSNRHANEIESICQDPVTNRIYGCFASNSEFVTSFTIGYYDYNSNFVNNVTKTEVKDATSFISNSKTIVYIDNNYEGLSDGSSTRPYKTIGEALVLSDVDLGFLDLNFADSNTPYYCHAISVINTQLAIRGTSNVVLDTCIRARYGDVNLNGIKFAPSEYHNFVNNQAAIYVYSHSTVECNNISIDLGHSNYSYGIFALSSEIRLLGIEIEDSTTEDTLISLGNNFFSRYGIRLEGTYGYIDNYVAKNINAFKSSPNGESGKITLKCAGITLTNSKGVEGPFPADYNSIFFGGINTLADWNKLNDLAKMSSPQTFSFIVSARITLENNSVVIPALYYADVNGVRSTSDSSIQDSQGAYGPTSSVPTSDKITRPGAVFYDTSRLMPISWDGNDWCDFLGNVWLDKDGNRTVLKSKGISVIPNVTPGSDVTETINADNLPNNTFAVYNQGDSHASTYHYPFGTCYVLTLEAAYISPNYKVQIALPLLSGTSVSEDKKRAKFRTKYAGTWSNWYDIGGNNLSGATADRPSDAEIGVQYFDTTLGKPIYWNGSNWVDATGATV